MDFFRGRGCDVACGIDGICQASTSDVEVLWVSGDMDFSLGRVYGGFCQYFVEAAGFVCFVED